MRRRTFIAGVAGVASSAVVDVKASPLLNVPSEIGEVIAQTSGQATVAKASAQAFEENALAREILQKALGQRVSQFSAEKYQFAQRLLEPSIQRSLPPARDLSRFDMKALAALPAGDPVRRELKELSGEVFMRRILDGAAVRDRAPAPGPPPSTCLVLSGGGAKGSLEVGFLAYLKRLWKVLNVTAVCGTSVGAVNAVPIAQSGAAGIDRLVELWLGLQTDSNMYIRHPQFESARIAFGALGVAVDDFKDLLNPGGLDKLAAALAIKLPPEVLVGANGFGAMIGGAAVGGPFGLVLGLAGLVGAGIAAGKAVKTVQELEAKFKLLGSALSTLFAAPGSKSFLPLEALILKNLDVSQLGQPGRPRLRLVMVGLEDGDLYYFTENGALLRGSANPSKATDEFWRGGATATKVKDAVIASSSPPPDFPAKALMEDHGAAAGRRTRHFVDGGVREVLPMRAAVELGCERVIGILVSTLRMPRERYTAPPPFLATSFRCAEAMLDEVTRSDTEYISDPAMRIVSHPETDVIDPFTIDPGLIRINVDYGYMRAFDATLGIAGKELGPFELMAMWLAEEAIVKLRMEIWALERAVVIPIPRGIPPKLQTIPIFNQKVLAQIRAKKRDVMEWTVDRFHATRKDRDSLPIAIDGASRPMTSIHDWWRTWERHEPGFLQASLSANRLWSPLRIGTSGPGNIVDILEPAGSVPDMPTTTEF